MAELLPCVEVEPRGEARGAVVWLHGLGASGHDFEDVVPLLECPDIRFVFPHAPQRPVTLNGGYVMPAWYDIASLDGPRGGERAADVRHSATLIDALLRRERQRGIEAQRTVLAGFSQGGALALWVGTRHPEPLAGIMVLSAYELLPETREQEASAANRATPILFCHGTQDPMVSVDRGRAAYERHRKERAAEWHEFPMGHQMCLQEIEVIRDWLAARFRVATTTAERG